MKFRTITSCVMLIVGLSGVGAGLYWRGSRGAVKPEAVVSKARSKSHAFSQFELPQEASDAGTRVDSEIVEDADRFGGVAELNAAYVRVRFAAWLANLARNPEGSRRAEAILEQHVSTVRRLEAQVVGPISAEVLESNRRALISKLVEAMRPVLNDAELIEFQRDLIWRELNSAIDQLGATLYLHESPLSTDQIMRLRSTFLESSVTDARAPLVFELASTDWNYVLAESAEFLSLDQLEQLRAFAKKAEFDRQYRNLVGLPSGQAIPGL